MGKSALTAQAFEERLAPLLESAAAYAYAIVRNRQDAEDAVQDAALKGWTSASRYDPARPFKAWWLVIVRNACRDLLRRRGARPPSAAIDPAEIPSRNVEQYGELRAALDQLSSVHREVLELRYFGGCSYREIAAALDIPEGTVMSRLYAARQALAEIYRKASHETR